MPTLSEAPAARLRMAVATAPQTGPDGQPTMHNDVQLVKSALLYADEVELIGMSASLVHATGMAPSAKQPTLIELVELTEIVSDEVTLTPELRRTITAMERTESRGQALPIALREQLIEIREFRQEAGRRLVEACAGFVGDIGMAELQPALDAGVVTVTDLGLTRADTIRAVTGKSLGGNADIQRWVDQIQSRLRDARTHLLLDDETASLIDAMVHEGELELSATARLLLGKAALGAGLVARLPTFPEAKVDELLQLREDLGEPLRRYRAAVVRISKTMPDIPARELDAAVQSEWEGVVAPELDAIKNGLADHGLIRELSKQARIETATYLAMGSGLFVGVDQLTDMSGALAGLVGAIPAVGGTLAKASLAHSAGRREVQRSEFYYLYSANKILGS